MKKRWGVRQGKRVLGGLISALTLWLVLPLVAEAQPTVEISLDEQAVLSASTFPVTFTFSEQIEGFTLDDIIGTNATIADLREIRAGWEYTVQVTPDPTASSIIIFIYDNFVQAVADGMGNRQALVRIELKPAPPPYPPCPPCRPAPSARRWRHCTMLPMEPTGATIRTG